MATYNYNQYPGDAPVSPTSSYGYEPPANYWELTQSPVSTVTPYHPVSPSSTSSSSKYDGHNGRKSAKQLRDDAIAQYRERKASGKALVMMEVQVTKQQSNQNPNQLKAKQLRDNAIAQHREIKASARALSMLEGQHGGAHVDAHYQQIKKSHTQLTAKQTATLRYDAYSKEESETKRVGHEFKKANPHPSITKKLVADKGLETKATSSRKKKDNYSKVMKDPETIREYKYQVEIEREKEAEKRALKYLTVFETAEGFQVV